MWLISSSAYYLAQDGEKPCVIPRKLQGLVPFFWQLALGHVRIHVVVVVCPQDMPPSLMEACVAMRRRDGDVSWKHTVGADTHHCCVHA